MATEAAWTWRYERADGTVLDNPPAPAVLTPFSNQVDAESWLGDVWRELLDVEVDAVTLLEDGVVVYGPMSLHPTP